jgi:hypothetical protein
VKIHGRIYLAFIFVTVSEDSVSRVLCDSSCYLTAPNRPTRSYFRPISLWLTHTSLYIYSNYLDNERTRQSDLLPCAVVPFYRRLHSPQQYSSSPFQPPQPTSHAHTSSFHLPNHSPWPTPIPRHVILPIHPREKLLLQPIKRAPRDCLIYTEQIPKCLLRQAAVLELREHDFLLTRQQRTRRVPVIRRRGLFARAHRE